MQIALLPQLLHEAKRAHHRDLRGPGQLRGVAVASAWRREQVLRQLVREEHLEHPLVQIREQLPRFASGSGHARRAMPSGSALRSSGRAAERRRGLRSRRPRPRHHRARIGGEFEHLFRGAPGILGALTTARGRAFRSPRASPEARPARIAESAGRCALPNAALSSTAYDALSRRTSRSASNALFLGSDFDLPAAPVEDELEVLGRSPPPLLLVPICAEFRGLFMAQPSAGSAYHGHVNYHGRGN